MSNSSLVNYTKLSPNHSGKRTHKIDRVTIHHMAGNLSVESVAASFANPKRQASCNYAIGTDGRIALIVEECNRSWCSSSNANDQRAITIEVANNSGAPSWTVSDAAMSSLIKLLVDVCKRNGIKSLQWTGNKNNPGNMTVHQWFSATACPGPYLMSKMPWIAQSVNKLLTTNQPKKLYKVQVGAFANKANADNLLKELEKKGYKPFIVEVVQ